MASQYFDGLFSHRVSVSSITDTTPPTFGGITSVTPNSDGSFTVHWLAGSSTKLPLRYEIYVAPGNVNDVACFQESNVAVIAGEGATQIRVFTLSDGSTYYVNGQTYTFGVRALDALSYESTSSSAIIVSTAIGSGNMPAVLQTIATDMAATEVLLAADHVNFQADHTDFGADHTNFQTDHANFVSDISDLNAIILAQENVLSEIAGGGGTSLVADLDGETVLNVEEIETA